MRAVALSLSIALLGCFPHNPKLRTYSQLAEGAAIVAGIGVEYFANTLADCQPTEAIGVNESGCKSTSSTVGNIGLGLILAGLSGFILTVTTAQDDKPPAVVELKSQQPDKPAVKLPPGVQRQTAANAPAAPSRPPP
jgi:hypothetical protein